MNNPFCSTRTDQWQWLTVLNYQLTWPYSIHFCTWQKKTQKLTKNPWQCGQQKYYIICAEIVSRLAHETWDFGRFSCQRAIQVLVLVIKWENCVQQIWQSFYSFGKITLILGFNKAWFCAPKCLCCQTRYPLITYWHWVNILTHRSRNSRCLGAGLFIGAIGLYIWVTRVSHSPLLLNLGEH